MKLITFWDRRVPPVLPPQALIQLLEWPLPIYLEPHQLRVVFLLGMVPRLLSQPHHHLNRSSTTLLVSRQCHLSKIQMQSCKVLHQYLLSRISSAHQPPLINSSALKASGFLLWWSTLFIQFVLGFFTSFDTSQDLLPSGLALHRKNPCLLQWAVHRWFLCTTRVSH